MAHNRPLPSPTTGLMTEGGKVLFCSVLFKATGSARLSVELLFLRFLQAKRLGATSLGCERRRVTPQSRRNGVPGVRWKWDRLCSACLAATHPRFARSRGESGAGGGKNPDRKREPDPKMRVHMCAVGRSADCAGDVTWKALPPFWSQRKASFSM